MRSLHFYTRILVWAGGAALAMGLAFAQAGSFIVTSFSVAPSLNSVRWLRDGTVLYGDGRGIYRTRGLERETLVTLPVDGYCISIPCGFIPTGYHPKPMTAGKDGEIYLADPEQQLLQRYDEFSKTVVNIVDGIGSPTSLAVGADGGVYFNDPAGCRVRRYFAGLVSTVAGTGTCGYSNDGGLATEAQILSVRGIAVDDSGQLFIADEKAGVIRRVDNQGVIFTIVGTGIPGMGGEETAANRTPLNGPAAVAVDAQGNLFIAEAGGNRVRMVDADGLIRTVAGTGASGHDGDDGPSIQAQLTSPQCLAVGPSGALQICDSDRIRHLIPPAPGRWWFPGKGLRSAVSPLRRFSAGSWMSLLGDFPGLPTTDWSDAIAASGGSLPTSLAGVSVDVGGLPCVIGYVSPDRIDVLLSDKLVYRPFIDERILTLTLPDSRMTTTIGIDVAAPEFLSFSWKNRFYVAGLTQEGILISPEFPARPGHTIRLYLTGLNIQGLVIPSPDVSQANGMSFFGFTAFLRILQARPAGPGIFELTVAVPDLPAGDVPLVLVVGADAASGRTISSTLPIWLPVGAN